MAEDYQERLHKEWLGYVQQSGLVVSAAALEAAQASLGRDQRLQQEELRALLPKNAADDPDPVIRDLPSFLRDALGWDLSLLNGAPGAPPLPDSLAAPLEAYQEALRPTFALRDFGSESDWLLLVEQLPPGKSFDDIGATHPNGWQASYQARFERLLRDTKVYAGLLAGNSSLRLVFAPEAESSGHVTFDLEYMVQTAGRPIWAACRMLLGAERLYSLSKGERLRAILENSRKFQGAVSTSLAGQVMEALFELLRGLQSADASAHGALLAETPNDQIYRGLVTVLLRLVFLLFAEDRGLLPSDAALANHYSLLALHARLRDDAARHPDTMQQRYGAWAQLIATFRLIFAGARHGTLELPARHGYLFDPARFPFLAAAPGEPPALPRVPDGVIYRVLDKLIVLDGERLSYRTLSVEQIGSVYQAIMGFDLDRAQGLSLAIKTGSKPTDAPITVNLEALLASPPSARAKRFADLTGRKLPPKAAAALRAAATVNDLAAALDRTIAKTITSTPVPRGDMILQPSDERRRTGSHYTPRSLTAPIVRETLAPLLAELGPAPHPEQILALKICDIAVGSGAFLVEACRQLGDALVEAWHRHHLLPELPPDEDATLAARRLVAQRCLYGVDRNPLATDLAKLSLWLETLAKDHPFTFLDHSIRSGDSLAGLTRRQIEALNWAPGAEGEFVFAPVGENLRAATSYRERILAARGDVPYDKLQADLALADDRLGPVREAGDAILSAFFAGASAKERATKRDDIARAIEQFQSRDANLAELDRAIAAAAAAIRRELNTAPFHWEIEFPEAFASATGGFDAIIGNPPFAGKNTLIAATAESYPDWLKLLHPESHGNSDLVAHFFRRAFTLLRPGGRFGLIATNTIAQGDTRATGLRYIRKHGGTIYRATKRLKWPVEGAAVVVSVVHIAKGPTPGPYILNSREVPLITAFLFHAGGDDDPARLRANADKSFQGSIVLGMGFTFDDTDTTGVATPIAEMHRLIAKDPRNAERIFPYIGGEEINTSPTQSHHRYVIDFGEMTEDEARRWPDLFEIVERRVKPERIERDPQKYPRMVHEWWKYWCARPGLHSAIAGLDRVLAISRVGQAFAFARLPAGTVYADSTDVIADPGWPTLAALQSRPHEAWARFLSSSMKDDLRYAPSDCFETFPFPAGYYTNPVLDRLGQEYYDFRAALMVKYNVGLTTTYNWFHDPEDGHPEIARLRQLHAAMDAAVLAAYGWHDIPTGCQFLPEFDAEEQAAEDDPPPARPSRKKAKFRLRWPDAVHDEVLMRLLALNAERAQAEALAGKTRKAAHKARGASQ